MNGTALLAGNAVADFRDRIAGGPGWRRFGVALGLGVAAVAALPPFHIVPLLVPALTGLVWLAESSPSGRLAFVLGWGFGLGFFGAGLYWISYAFLVDGDRFGWMVPFGVPGLAAVLALYVGVVCWLTRTYGRPRGRPYAGARRILVFAGAWTAAEWVRGFAFTGFPWNLIGTVWTLSDSMIQLAALTGVHGLSLLTVAAAAMPAVLADGDPRGLGGVPPHPPRAIIRRGLPVAIAILALAAVGAGGAIRLANAEPKTVPGVRLRLVQPNIDQKLKWIPELRQSHVLQQLEMSLRPPAATGSDAGLAPTHVIWAETAIQYLLANEPQLLLLMASAVPTDGLLIAGSLRTTPEPTSPFRVWNSLHAVDERGRVVATYDKFHLVPFGEYVPFRGFLKLSKLTVGEGDFSAGPGLRTLRLPGLPAVSPLICYEAVFPGRVVDAGDRPQWILNLTNDAWYGLSAGPYQHFAAARMRAVEQGLPLVRVANTGISAVVDPWGRIVASLSLGHAGVIDSPLPEALSEAPLYGRLADWMTAFLVLAALAGGRWPWPGARAEATPGTPDTA